MDSDMAPMNPMMEMAAEGLGQKTPTKPEIHMHIRPTHDNKFIVEHHEHVHGRPTGKKVEHAPSTVKELAKHVSHTYGEKTEKK